MDDQRQASIRRLTVAVTCAVAVALGPGAHAAPPPAAGSRAAAEQLERDATVTGEPAKFAACGQAYRDLYDADPVASDADEVLYNAAICFERGSRIGLAVQALKLLHQRFPRSGLDARALARLATMYAQIAYYDRSADHLEEYARKYAGEKDALAALSDALHDRITFGPDAKAIEDAHLVVKLFGAKRRAEAAEAMFALIPVYERGGAGDPLIAHLHGYLRDHARAGGADREVIVMGRLGEELWRRSCPVAEIDGLCLQIVRARPARPSKATARPTQCGPASTPRISAVARDATRAREARQVLAAAVKRYERIAKAGATPMTSAASTAARAQVIAADAEFEAFLALEFPRGLDFDRDRRRVQAASSERFTTYLGAKQKLGSAATSRYQAAIALKDGSASITAMARVGQLSLSFADALLAAALPRGVGSGPNAKEEVETYCAVIADVIAPLRAQATTAFEVCLAKAGELGIDDASSRLCARELRRLAPEHDVDEVLAPLPAPSVITVEAASRPTSARPAAFTAALTAFADQEQRGWTPAACRAHAGQFAAIEKAHPTDADAAYMIGLSLHRCGLDADARRAYARAARLRPDHSAARSNLAELEWRAGRRELAIKGWEAALAVDGWLYAARVNLAAVAIDELRLLSAGAAARAKLATEARAQLSRALAVDADRADAYVAFASLEAERPTVARFYLEQASRLAPRQLSVRLVHAAAAARRGALGAALAHFDAALTVDPTSDAAQLGRGDALLRLRRWDAARLALARVKRPGYAAHVATGVALAHLGRGADALVAYERAVAAAAAPFEAHHATAVVHDRAAAAATDAAVQRAALVKAAAAYRRAATAATGDPQRAATTSAAERDRSIAALDAKLKAPPRTP